MAWYDEYDEEEAGAPRRSTLRPWASRASVAEATLRKVCKVLADEHKITITLASTEAGGSYDPTKKELRIGTRDLWKHSADYYIGMILHEIAHLRYSPAELLGKETKTYRDSLLLVEDMRIEERMRETYGGAADYLDALNDPSLLEFSYELAYGAKNPTSTLLETRQLIGVKLNNNWQRVLTEDEGEAFYHGKPPTKEPTQTGLERAHATAAKKIENEIGRRMYKVRVKAVMLAVLRAEGRQLGHHTTGNGEADAIALAVSTHLQKARYAEAEEVPAIAKKVEALLLRIARVPEENNTGGACVGTGEEGRGVTTLEKLKEALAGIKAGTETSMEVVNDPYYAEADAWAKERADSFTRKLMRKMRENERTRTEGGKRRGRLDKKRIAKAAIPSTRTPRIYERRIIPKGKRYSVGAVVDVSGSMFQSSTKIMGAFRSAALLARSFRKLGNPSSVVLFGIEAVCVLDPRARYVGEEIVNAINGSGGVYASGTWISRGLESAIPRLIATSAKHTPVLFIVTDGEASDGDKRQCRELLEEAHVRAGVLARVLYIVPDREEAPRQGWSLYEGTTLPAYVREVYVEEDDAGTELEREALSLIASAAGGEYEAS